MSGEMRYPCLPTPIELLVDSRFHEDTPYTTKLFDKITDLQFRDPNDPSYIKFGSARDRDPNKGTRGGRLKLEGHTLFLTLLRNRCVRLTIETPPRSLVAKIFEPSIQCIFEAVLAQKEVTSTEKSISLRPPPSFLVVFLSHRCCSHKKHFYQYHLSNH